MSTDRPPHETVPIRADRHALVASYGFPLDRFQLEALDALDAGESVLVAAPTGSGKTVIAEYAIAAALADGNTAFYTAPIKALSNQKYHDLCAIHGAERVGLLTGDNAINPDADVVVMTTEVLRNMVYAGSAALDRLQAVVLDEVHFLQDTYRGPVWEEVIIHLRHDVRLVCLSATVSNAAELAEWISTVRGPTRAIVEATRPVRLEQLYMVGDRTAERVHLLPTLVDGAPNPEASRLDAPVAAGRRTEAEQRRRKRPLYTPSRIDVVERLAREEMLPAIEFIFSRNQCDEAARTCLGAGIRLTTAAERRAIRDIIDRRLAGWERTDLSALGFASFAACLEAGIAAHHAGMVPAFKETVEELFTAGLVKIVFATETLAVGINMPARTVVIEKLTKFKGDHHDALTPGEYTQLTGRAGRRGIDPIGHAVVLWNPFVPFDQVAALAQSREFHLRSAFRPTFNMAANLVRTYTAAEAHRLLNQSFAQYQADGDVVRLEARIERRARQHAELFDAAQSPHGDIEEYRRQRDDARTEAPAGGPNAAVGHSLGRLTPGDIFYLELGRYAGRVVVLSAANRKGGVKLQVLSPGRKLTALSEPDFEAPVVVLGHLSLPTPYAPNRESFRRDVARELERAVLAPRARKEQRPPAPGERHPVLDDPDLERRLKRLGQADRLRAEMDQLRERIDLSADTLSKTLDAVLRLLERRGYVVGWQLTDAGTQLAGTFHECDLLIVECCRDGVFDDLDPASLAALVSAFTYEHRSPEPPPAPWFPSLKVRQRWERIVALSEQLQAEERAAGLLEHRAPDATFSSIAYAWAAGTGLADVLEAEQLSGGDFVRNIKQLMDLLRQLATTGTTRALRHVASQAAETLLRGVIADATAVSDERASTGHAEQP